MSLNFIRLISFVLMATVMTSCSTVKELEGLDISNYSYQDGMVKYGDVEIAYLSNKELALDKGSITYEVTFKLNDVSYGEHALYIIKLIKDNNPNEKLEVEVDLGVGDSRVVYQNNLLK